MSLKLRHFFLLVFLGINQLAFAQGQGKSPYSSIGIGELTDETIAAQDMMGGTGVSFSNMFYLNGLNPALLAKGRVVNGLKYVALSVSGKGYFRNLEQNGTLGQDFGMNLSNLAMAFPVSPKWTIGVSFKPYSMMDNEKVLNTHFQGSSSIATYNFRDYGGLSKVGFTNSVNPVKGLYLGVEGQYYFVNITIDTTMNFIGSGSYTRYTRRQELKGLSLKGGVAYQHKISKKWSANIGGTYQLGNDIKGENINIFRNLVETSGAGPAVSGDPDTLSISDFTTSLPSKYKIGVSLEKPFNWVFAAEYGFTNWEGISKHFDQQAANTLRNSTEMNFGVEWIPNVSSSSYFNQVFYRVGFKSVNTPYYINNTQIKDNSFTFGMSLPMGRGTNYLDLGVALGRRGTTSNGLVQENYAKASVSFSLTRDWFHRPRIN
jgi:hypothetical protein